MSAELKVAPEAEKHDGDTPGVVYVSVDSMPIQVSLEQPVDFEKIRRITIQIDVAELAANRDSGTIFLRGYMEERKVEILNIIAGLRKRQDAAAAGKIIVPGQSGVKQKH